MKLPKALILGAALFSCTSVIAEDLVKIEFEDADFEREEVLQSEALSADPLFSLPENTLQEDPVIVTFDLPEEPVEEPLALETAIPAMDTAEELAEPILTGQLEAPTQEIAFNTLKIEKKQIQESSKAIQISFQEVFSGSPIIYTLLIALSVFAFGIWLYNLFTLKSSASVNEDLIKAVKNKLTSNQYDEALGICLQSQTLLCKMISSGIASRKHGHTLMLDSMRTEGKRASAKFWQRTSLLNDIAIIAPMIGLLGTVLGMFYAFYDLHRSLESITTLFDGLGISVGTTVAGLMVAILALILQSSMKYRLAKALSQVETEAKIISGLME